MDLCTRQFAVLVTLLSKAIKCVAIINSAMVSHHGPSEYCELDVFRANCSSDEVVLITEAKYGLVLLGRCMQTDYGYVGCYTDVADYLNSKCAGRRSCEQRQPDRHLTDVNKCPKEFKAFLYVSYKCIKVDKRPCRSCSNSGHAKLTAASGYISSIVTAETQDDESCGSTRCPWSIAVQPGQVINITLLDYSYQQQQQQQRARSSSSEPCPRYALIKERANPKDSPICGGNRKEMHVYTSVSNNVEIQIISQDVFNWNQQFLIHYEAIGCPDIIPPKNSWLKRIDDKFEVGCSLTGEKWDLTCVGTNWQGSIGSCGPDQPAAVGMLDSIPKTANSIIGYITSLPFGILIAALIATAAIFGVLILTIGVVCFKRSQHAKRPRPAVPPSEEYADLPADYLVPKGMAQSTLMHKQSEFDDPMGRENKYANCRQSRMDARPLPSLPDLRASGGASMQRSMVGTDRGQLQQQQLMQQQQQQQPPRMMIRSFGPDNATAAGLRRVSAGPARPGSYAAYSQNDPHEYFIIDPWQDESVPDLLYPADQSRGSLLHERKTMPRGAPNYGTRQMMTSSMHGAIPCGIPTLPGEQDNVPPFAGYENDDVRAMNNTMEEIPSRMQQQQQQQQQLQQQKQQQLLQLQQQQQGQQQQYQQQTGRGNYDAQNVMGVDRNSYRPS